MGPESLNFIILNVLEYHYFRINHTSDNKIDKEQYIDLIFRIRNLFTFLLLKPIFPKEINLYNDNKKYSILYPIYLTEQQVVATEPIKDSHYFHLPVNLSDIKDSFESSLKYWLEFSNWDLNFTYETILEHIMSADYDHIGHYLLLIASIERWKNKHNGKHSPKQRVDDFLQVYMDKELEKSFLSLLPNATKSIGVALTDMRNIVLHPKKIEGKEFTKYKNYTSAANFYNLSEKIFMLFVIALHKQMGSSEEVIKKIREKLPNGLRSWGIS